MRARSTDGRRGRARIARHTGEHALTLAARSDSAETVEHLLSAGARINTPAHDGATALFVAVECGAAAAVYGSVRVLGWARGLHVLE